MAKFDGLALKPSSTLRARAVTYGRSGLRVLPTCPVDEAGTPLCGLSSECRPGRHPLISKDEATTDAETIRDLWTNMPLAGVAVVTGYYPDQGAWLVAFDDDEGGEALRRYEAEHGRVPGPRWRTGSGGIRVLAWSREPIPNDSTTFDGLEILGHGDGTRTLGGIAVLLGRNENGPYTEVAPRIKEGIPVLQDEAPGWAEALEEPADAGAVPRPSVEKGTQHRSGALYDEFWWRWVAKQHGKQHWREILQGNSIVEGSRNTELFRMGRSLLAWYASEETIRALLSFVNGTKCVDEAGEPAPLDSEEVGHIMENVLRKKPGPSGTLDTDTPSHHCHDPAVDLPCEVPIRLARFEAIDGAHYPLRCGDCHACRVRRRICCIPDAVQEIVDKHEFTTVLHVEDAERDQFKNQVLDRWRRRTRRRDETFSYVWARTPSGFLIFTNLDAREVRDNFEAYPTPFPVTVETIRDGEEAKTTLRSEVSILLRRYRVTLSKGEDENPPGPTDISDTPSRPGTGGCMIDGSRDVTVPRYAIKPPVVVADAPGRTMLKVEGEWVPVATQEALARARTLLKDSAEAPAQRIPDPASDKDAENEEPPVSILQQPKTAEQPETVIPLDGHG